MKSIKEKVEELSFALTEQEEDYYSAEDAFWDGANYVLDAITECMPKTHSFNPNEVIDIISSRIKELKGEMTMAYHNEDIAACMNDHCSKRLTCLRWQIGTNKDPYQTYLDGSMCDEEFYVDNKDFK